MSSPLLPPLLCINGFYPHLPLLPPSSVSFCSNVKLPFRLLWRMMCRLFFRLVPCHKTALQPKPFHFGFLFLISLCSSQHLYRSGHALTTYLHCNLSLAFILSLPLGFIFVLLLLLYGFFRLLFHERHIERERERFYLVSVLVFCGLSRSWMHHLARLLFRILIWYVSGDVTYSLRHLISFCLVVLCFPFSYPLSCFTFFFIILWFFFSPLLFGVSCYGLLFLPIKQKSVGLLLKCLVII